VTTVQIALDVDVRPFGLIGVLSITFCFFIPIGWLMYVVFDRILQHLERRQARNRSK
jgi:hypothetical protein